MTENFQGKVFAVVDHHGLFLPLALRLGETGAKVWYCTPQDRRDLLNDGIVGDGMKKRGVFCTDDYWLHKAETDTFVFPDIRHCGEQLELRSQGKAVWGAGRGMDLELDRIFFLQKLRELGLDVPPFEVVTGLSKLADYLKEKEDIWIKVSKWRGSWETFHWRSQKQDAHNLDLWRVRFGGLKELIRFICFPKIETDLEIGADTYNVRGQWPEYMLHGIERKDEAYFSAVTKREDMPEQLTPVMDAFSPYLEEVGYACQWSMEVRVAKDANYFIDATTRGGLPSTASFLKARNVAEVIYHGARGEFVEIEYGFKFSAEAMVKISGQPGAWDTIDLDPEVKAELMLSDCCEVNGQTWFPADEEASISEIGWLRATGDTPTEVGERMNELADMLPDGADANVEALADVIREIESEHKQGIHFTDAKMPPPEIVLAEET
jgi:hypothetical protein